MRWQGKKGRKPTGGKLICPGQRKFEIGKEQSDTTIMRRGSKTRSGAELRSCACCGQHGCSRRSSDWYDQDGEDRGCKENKANQHYVRRSILTKGAVIKTEIGDARITNRPGQDGVINARLLPAE